MTNRFINPRPQFLDAAGKPLLKGEMNFYENGTLIRKDTFSDVNEKNKNTNPVLLNADGTLPNVFYAGTARTILTFDPGTGQQQRFDLDGVGQFGSGAAFDDFNTLTEYEDGAIVVASDGEIYRSLQNNNTGNDPVASPSFWEQVNFLRTYNVNVTYGSDAIVIASNGLIFRSLQAANLNNDPLTSPLFWGTPVAFVNVNMIGDLSFAATELTISAGSVAALTSHHTIDTEADAASDDLDTITVAGVADFTLLFLRLADAARVVTLKDGTGNIQTKNSEDIILDANIPTVLFRVGTDWFEIQRTTVDNPFDQSLNATDDPTFNSLTLTNPLAITEGGTGSITANKAIVALGVNFSVDDIAELKTILKADLPGGDRAFVASHTTFGDQGEGHWEWDAASTATDNNGTIVASGEGGVGRWLRILTEPWSSAWFGVVTDKSTDNTAKIQAALDVAKGVLIENPQNAFFNLKNLAFPNGNFAANKGRYALSYIANDDISDPAHPAGNDTSERVIFIQNNNPSGYSNEFQSSSGQSTGIIGNIRRDVNTPNLGAGQDILFGRVSFVWRQDGFNRSQFKYTDGAGDDSTINTDDGLTMQWHERFQTITGIDQSSFVATLAVGNMIKGSTSGARSRVRTIGAGSITAFWLSGDFSNGETVILEPAVETTTDTISDVGTFSNSTPVNVLAFSRRHSGNMGTRLFDKELTFPFNVGGAIQISQKNTLGTSPTPEVFIVDDPLSVTQQVRYQMDPATGEAVIRVGTGSLEAGRFRNLAGTSVFESGILTSLVGLRLGATSTASAVGTLIAVQRVDDASGSLVGFIPIHASFTS